MIDFTQVIAGPYASYQLALQGADVIKVENPKGGDQGRVMMGATPEFVQAGQSTLFMSFNSGKRREGGEGFMEWSASLPPPLHTSARHSCRQLTFAGRM